jgi:hypothetical protein
MRFGHDGTFARCTRCEGEDFYPAFPFTPDRREVMVCTRCENQALYSDLIKRTRPGVQTAEKEEWTPPQTPADKPPTRRNRQK